MDDGILFNTTRVNINLFLMLSTYVAMVTEIPLDLLLTQGTLQVRHPPEEYTSTHPLHEETEKRKRGDY